MSEYTDQDREIGVEVIRQLGEAADPVQLSYERLIAIAAAAHARQVYAERIKALEEKSAAFAKRIKSLRTAMAQLLSACERLDAYEIKSTEFWDAYHFASSIYDESVWLTEKHVKEADQ